MRQYYAVSGLFIVASGLGLLGCSGGNEPVETTFTFGGTSGDGDPGDGDPGDGDPGDGDPGDGDPGDGDPGDGDGDPGDGDPGDGDPGDGDPGDGDGDPVDTLAPSDMPPGGLSVDQVPMFVSLGWDDNAYSGLDGSGGTGGMTWSLDMAAARSNPAGSGNAGTYDGINVTMSYYFTGVYIGVWQSESPTYVKKAWRRAYDEGHEVGNHTYSHLHGGQFSGQEWNTEIQDALDWLNQPFDPNEGNVSPDETKGIGVPNSEIYGFRTPFLEYNDATLTTVQDLGFVYDCSIEEGWQIEQDGTNYNWPFTLDQGSPGHDILVDWGLKEPITSHPGLWEMPVHPVIVPPDEACADYGIPMGLRAKAKAIASWFDEDSGKITGFDYNLWVSFEMTKEEFVATLQYTLDQRLEGNRAPMMFGTHTDYYSTKYTAPPNSTAPERQEAIEEFLDYALSKPEVRVVSNKQILDWVRQPVPL